MALTRHDGDLEGIASAACVADLVAALATPARVGIVRALANGGALGVGQLAARLHRSVVNMSHHLTRLRAARIVTSRKAGARVVNALTNPCVTELFTSAAKMCP